MPAFSRRSRGRLSTCHPDLIRVFEKVVERFDCSILQGYRGRRAQEEAYRTGRSKLNWPRSKHNRRSPEDPGRPESLAVDAAPWPIDWDDLDRFRVFGGYVIATAHAMGVELRWGGDWDRDWNLRDQRFNDLPHFELVGRR